MGQRIPVTLGNIAPLSLRPFQPGSMALVCEGGGQRGIFTAGVQHCMIMQIAVYNKQKMPLNEKFISVWKIAAGRFHQRVRCDATSSVPTTAVASTM